ncbi:helix-turn-helix domain-containing protein [Actinoplanes sp. NPDC051470]|uniref:TetR/AcrR family transcriptional regulator n=1 Tax=unclassified Actinoplanes TaxID=2626549 RepID=UPI003425BC33
MPPRARRSAADTRAEIHRVALELFTEKGFDATTTRDIAAALGMNQSSLYYHFAGKEEILRSLLEQRRRDVDTFLEWLETRPRTPGLLREAALRWLDNTGEEHVYAQRFALANQAIQRRLGGPELSVPAAFERVVAHFAGPGAPAADVLYIRAVFNTVGSVLAATYGAADVNPADVLAAARRMVLALTA